MGKEDPKASMADAQKADAPRVATDEEKVAIARVKAAMAGDLRALTADDLRADAQKATQEGPKAATAAGQRAHAQRVPTDGDQKAHALKAAMEDVQKAGQQKDAKAAMDEGLRAAIAGQKEPEATAMTEGRQKADMTGAQKKGQARLCARNSCTSHACQCRKH